MGNKRNGRNPDEKDTKVIYDISFDSIKVAYNRQQGSLLNVEPVSERFEDFLMDSLLNALKIMQNTIMMVFV